MLLLDDGHCFRDQALPYCEQVGAHELAFRGALVIRWLDRLVPSRGSRAMKNRPTPPISGVLPAARWEVVPEPPRREGDDLVVDMHDPQLPDRCVICNARADGYKETITLSVNTALRFVIGGVLDGVHWVTSAVTPYLDEHLGERSGTVALGLCQTHRNRRFITLVAGWTVSVVSLCLILLGIWIASAELIIASFVAMIVSPIVASLMRQFVYATMISNRRMCLRVGRPFLESIPASPSRRTARVYRVTGDP